MVKQLTRPQSDRTALWRRFLGTMSLALLGAALGYYYASVKLSPELLAGSSLPGMYASSGAIGAVLVVRMFGIFRSLFFDESSRRSGPDDSPPPPPEV